MSENRDRLLYNEDGQTLDEICWTGDTHLEQEDDDAYYLRCGESLFNLNAELYIDKDEEDREVVRARLVVSARDLEESEYPLIQRHRTDAEVAEWMVDTTPGKTYITLKDERVPA